MQYIFIIVSALIIFIGLYIKEIKKIEIINQVNKYKSYDGDKLSAFAANNLLIMGVFEVLLSIIFYVISSQKVSIGEIFLVQKSY